MGSNINRIEFYKPRGDVAKKEWEESQKNEYTRVDDYQEGLCFCCEKYKDVQAGFLDICFPCFYKCNKKAILNTVRVHPDGLCLMCGRWPKIEYKWNLITFNVRHCPECAVKIRKRGQAGGPNPVYTMARKQYGKDYGIMTGLGGLDAPENPQ